MAAKDKLRSYFERNVGEIVTTQQLRKVAGISEYARRIRELRDDEGMQIRSYRDRDDLKSNEYVLESLERIPVIGQGISPKLRMEILERNGFTCQLCGATANDPDPYNPKRKARLHVDHRHVKSQGGKASTENLRTLCSACNQGRKNIETPHESSLNLLARVRRAPRGVQKEVYEALKKTFRSK